MHIAWSFNETPSQAPVACRLLVDCNQLAVDIDNELVVVHNWVRIVLR